MSATGNMTIWMRLRNAREVIAGLRSTAAATGLLGNTTDRLARQLERAGRRTFLMNQALFTLRRYSYMITLGLTAATAAVVKWGFQYNSQVQEANVAFHKFGMTNRQVNGEIKELYRLAAISPFLFTDITNAARRFLAFGIDVQTTNKLVTNLTDALTALGVANTASLNRASLAIAHMYSLGRVTGQIIYQLARDNVPIIQALEKELGLTGEQLRNVGTLGIPASVAIQALNKYISETPRFHNAALIFATKTWRGIVTTTRDYMAQFIGRVEQPLFLRLQAGARKFLFWLQGAGQRGFDRGGITGLLGTFSPGAARVWQMLAGVLTAVWQILVGGVIPAFRYVAEIILPTLIIILTPTIKALQFLGQHAWLTRVFFALLALEIGVLALRFAVLLPIQAVLITRMIVINTLNKIGIALGLRRLIIERDTRGAIIATTIVTTKAGEAVKLLLLLRFREAAALLVSTRLWRLYTVATVGSIRASNGQFVAMTRLEKVVLRMRFGVLALSRAMRAFALATLATARSMLVFLFTNPVGWAILLTGALIVLYFRWQRFHNFINKTFSWVVDHAPYVAAGLALAFGPIGVAVGGLLLIIKYWNKIKSILPKRSDLPFNLGMPAGFGFHNPFKGLHIPGLATGGYVTSGGLALVGEGGPEVLSLPRGASVSPIGATAGLRGEFPMEFTIYNHSTLEVDGEKMAENVSKHRLDASARR